MKRISILSFLVLILCGGAYFFWASSHQSAPSEGNTKVVINEAVRTLLYLPLYVAKHEGFFEQEGLNVEIVTGGTATASFAAMLSGEAHFSQADPMYVPISRVEGSDAVVVAQVVGRIAVWGFTNDETISEFSADAITGKSISTHSRPMTAYTYAVRALRDIGLAPDIDVEILQSRPGGELAALLAGQSQVAFALEPATSIAESQGARVILSFPEILGDQVFTALMTTEKFISEQPDTALRVARAYQRSLDYLSQSPQNALPAARAYFPSVSLSLLETALQRLVREQVFPTTILISEESWSKAVAERVAIGDLTAPYPYESALALSTTKAAIE